MASDPYRLSPDILLCIFDYLLACDSTWGLVQCAGCCKMWYRQAQYVLYRDVVLSGLALPRFISSPLSAEATASVRTLTIRLNPVEYTPQAITPLLIELASGHLRNMTNLKSLSIYKLARSLRNGFNIPADGLAAMLDSLPESCTALEIESRHLIDRSASFDDYIQAHLGDTNNTHLCHHIRKILPQLRYLRLRVNTLCPDLFGTGFQYDPKESSDVLTNVTPLNLPHLKECVINLSRKWGHCIGPNGPENSALCPHQLTKGAIKRPCLPLLALQLRHMAETGHIARAEKVWLLTHQPNPRAPKNPNKYAAFVRRDILANTSLALPHRDIGAFMTDTWHLRRPAGRGAVDEDPGWEDMVGFSWAIEQLAEGPAWEASVRGVRLPAALMSRSGNHEVDELPVLPRSEFYARRKLNNVLWANEDRVGRRLLEPTTKDLLAEHEDLDMSVPAGWHFPQEGAAFLEKVT